MSHELKVGSVLAVHDTLPAVNAWATMELPRTRQHTLVPLDHLANLLGVSRQSLYRLREVARNIPPTRTVADWLTETDETGAFVHSYG